MSILNRAHSANRPDPLYDYSHEERIVPQKLRKPRLNGFTIFGIVVAIVYLIGWACSR